MDQDVLTNGALGALWQRDQARRMSMGKKSSRCAPQTPQQRRCWKSNSGLIKSPGFLVNCISPKKGSDISLGFPRLQFSGGQKRKSAGSTSTISWPQLQKVSSSSSSLSWSSSSLASPRCGPPPAKKTKFNLKEMAEQFTASQVELVARSSFMLPRGGSRCDGSSKDKDNQTNKTREHKKLPGISESINLFLNPQKSDIAAVESTIQEQQEQQEQQDELEVDQRESSSMDMMSSWDLDPTPIREPTPTSSLLLQLEPTPIVEPTPIKEELPFSSSPCSSFPFPATITTTTCTPAVEEPSSLLHQTIRLFSTNYDLVKNALELNQKDIRCKSPLASTTTSTSKTESYGYPLNVAIVNNSSLDVLELLVNAAPDVVTSPDGCDDRCAGSLFLVLEHLTNSNSLLQVVQLLIKANPKALLQTNSMGESILQVAQRTMAPGNHVLKFLEEAYKQELQRDTATRS